MPRIEHVALHVSLSVLCTQKHVLHGCLQGFCKKRTHCVPNLWKNPHVEKFPERALVWDICPKRSYASAILDADPLLRGMTMCQLRMDVSEVRCSQCMFGVWGAQQGGCNSKLLLETGICFLPHSPPSSSRPCMGNTVCFFLRSISLFHLTTL